MKKYSFPFFVFLFILSSTHAYGYDGNAPLFEDESLKWLNLNLVLFVAGIIMFISVTRRLYDARLQRQKMKNAPPPKARTKDNIYQPRYWYQCRNCRITIRKDSPPNKADCFKAVDHHWTQLAEVGSIKFLCKNCNTLIETRGEPVAISCPDEELHNWQRLS